MRVIVGQDAKVLSPLFVNDDEVATNADSTPTVTVVDSEGDSLAAPTVAATTSTGRYTATLTDAAHTTQLDSLDLVWSGVVGNSTRSLAQQVDVVGGRLFSVAELRAEPSLTDASLFPTTLLGQIRDEVEDFVERWCGVAFNPRFTLETLYADGGCLLRPTWGHGRTVRTITADGVNVSADNWSFTDTGHLIYQGSIPQGVPIAVGYEHGWSSPPPLLVRECLRWARRQVLARSAKVTADVLSESVDGLTTRYALPDPSAGRPTGVLALDPLLMEYSHRLLVA